MKCFCTNLNFVRSFSHKWYFAIQSTNNTDTAQYSTRFKLLLGFELQDCIYWKRNREIWFFHFKDNYIKHTYLSCFGYLVNNPLHLSHHNDFIFLRGIRVLLVITWYDLFIPHLCKSKYTDEPVGKIYLHVNEPEGILPAHNLNKKRKRIEGQKLLAPFSFDTIP